MRTGLILFVTCAPWGMWTPGREGLGINTSIVFMGCSQPSRLALPGSQEPLVLRGIDSVGAEGVSWGRTAVVLGARENRAQGEGR